MINCQEVFKTFFNKKLSHQGLAMNKTFFKSFLLPKVFLKFLVLLALKATFMSYLIPLGRAAF